MSSKLALPSSQNSQLYVGLLSSVAASCMFAFLPWYIHQFPLEPNSGNWLAAQRIVWSCLLMLIGLGLMKQLPLIVSQLVNVKAWPRLMVASILVGLQFWLFIWAPANGQTLPVALGYFSLPLVLVLVGRFVYQERLSRVQWVAVCVAGLGVAYAYLMADGLSWVVLLVAFGYPLYFMLRRKYPLPSHIAFTVDNLLLLPLAIVYLLLNDGVSVEQSQIVSFYNHSPWLYYFGLGIAGTVPMLLFLLASNHLPLSLFGLMGYLEPVLVFSVGWLLGERLSAEQWPTYILIVLALLLLAIDGSRRGFKRKASVSLN
ncbi:EamA family transporter RarD [Agarivorans sp. Toyoura001]|uniref:EamA family transporter RarD n=1 Tax=Agarivorans sp. Toyoura001 TaxID=2283141 RepID=UPI001F1B3FBA|nr:EamA family transporter RarD [Agarivorans sp. Toyoura001]